MKRARLVFQHGPRRVARHGIGIHEGMSFDGETAGQQIESVQEDGISGVEGLGQARLMHGQARHIGQAIRAVVSIDLARCIQKLPSINRNRAFPFSSKLICNPVAPTFVGNRAAMDALWCVLQPADPASNLPASYQSANPGWDET